ncbi:MAG TPA: hypothetical protein IGS17_15225 [Oscillatoriales cyanobacterium M59_W2019_021]|nr:hypothetical protein [Oscillatoriales cyanobacterium M4454_W2019_049]HIK52258.1 hypothetical protein [Oscillatoriales cyanobacterium M59_W2019_021]
METNTQTQLFVELSADESATVNGAHRYYYAPRYYSPCRYGGYGGGYYGGGYGYGGGGYGGGYGSGGSVTQTTNVNVVIED